LTKSRLIADANDRVMQLYLFSLPLRAISRSFLLRVTEVIE
jgi:hypothetical protein